MSHGNSRGQTGDNFFSNTSNCGRVCLFSQNKTTIFAKCIVRQVPTSVTSVLLAVRTSTVAIASSKETMIT